ncbi:MAG: nitroreductase [Clostridia bacterium]|nr:nitroreductase [Clostridia bacterium]
MNGELYGQILRRRSFHYFKDVGDESLTAAELSDIEKAWQGFTPLYPEIKTEIRIVRESETNCRIGAEYCVLIYSEAKDGCLPNVGYLGEQLDLWLVSKGVGTLWCGIGKPKVAAPEGLEYVIMIAIRKVDDPAKFRGDAADFRRKAADEIWEGEQLAGVTDLVRFAPSACNSQPWLVKNDGGISVFRRGKTGLGGIVSAFGMLRFNRIDMGIFLCFLEVCLEREGFAFERSLCADVGGDSERALNAVYKIK